VCAAPGGKTLILADDLQVGCAPNSLLVAADRRSRRLTLLRTTLARVNRPIPLVALDALRPLPFGPVFDAVLLDVPCSGVGTLRRDPDVKWTRQQADLARLADDERRMLGMAATLVRPGGRLVYATCSSEPEENEAVVDDWLSTRPDFARAVPTPGGAVAPDLLDPAGRLRTLPFRDGLDAYFAAVLVRAPSA
jgi:16S rRNA (cytosine967-C5)-methyltransferase